LRIGKRRRGRRPWLVLLKIFSKKGVQMLKFLFRFLNTLRRKKYRSSLQKISTNSSKYRMI
jgi:hypothetical protein